MQSSVITCLCPLCRVYWETSALFRRHAGIGIIGVTVASEWENLKVDLMELAAPGSAAQKAETCRRVQRVYSLFQP
jgi:nuclear-control-of-ATPase protein 2